MKDPLLIMSRELFPGLAKVFSAVVLWLALGGVIFSVVKVMHFQDQEWAEVKFNEILTFRSPVSLSRTEDKGIDSTFAMWKAENISVQIDYGLFSDALTSYGNRTNYTLLKEEIDGRPARIVSFDRQDGTQFVAAHFYDLVKLAPGNLKKLVLRQGSVVEISLKLYGSKD